MKRCLSIISYLAWKETISAEATKIPGLAPFQEKSD